MTPSHGEKTSLDAKIFKMLMYLFSHPLFHLMTVTLGALRLLTGLLAKSSVFP